MYIQVIQVALTVEQYNDDIETSTPLPLDDGEDYNIHSPPLRYYLY